MAVIIDTFEVISEAESATSSASSSNNAQSSSGAAKPTDIEAVLEYQYLRNNRLRAH